MAKLWALVGVLLVELAVLGWLVGQHAWVWLTAYAG